MVEHLPSKCKALHLVISSGKKIFMFSYACICVYDSVRQRPQRPEKSIQSLALDLEVLVAAGNPIEEL